MTSKKAVRRAVVLALAAATVVTGAVASDGARAGDGGNQLAGTWKVAVMRPAPLTPITSLQAFTADGSMIESASDSFTRTPAYGSWERIDGRLYAASGVFMRFDPQTGAHIGFQRIDRTIRLAPDGQTFAAIARATQLDVNGNVLASFRVPSTGERLAVERIPDEP